MGESYNSEDLKNREYKYGFETEVETVQFPKGLSEEIINKLSDIKNEPDFVREYRLKAYKHWKTLKEPEWGTFEYEKVDFDELTYYSAPKSQEDGPKSLDEIDPEILETFNKLVFLLLNSKEFQVLLLTLFSIVYQSVPLTKKSLKKFGVIFCSLSEAIENHPDLVKKYLGTVVTYKDNYYAALNAAVFTDGSFCYIPKGVRCPLDLSTYFRINSAGTGQFERTLVVAEDGSYVSYFEGCTAPQRDENQLHAAVVELIAKENAQIKYSTVQNWYAGDDSGKGGIYNFVTKRGLCAGKNSYISWTQVEAGSAITWKYPSCILKGDNSKGEFYSVALTNHKMQADTGTKMIHIGKNTKSKIISKGISVDESINSYRGQVVIQPSAHRC